MSISRENPSLFSHLKKLDMKLKVIFAEDNACTLRFKGAYTVYIYGEQ